MPCQSQAHQKTSIRVGGVLFAWPVKQDPGSIQLASAQHVTGGGEGGGRGEGESTLEDPRARRKPAATPLWKCGHCAMSAGLST